MPTTDNGYPASPNLPLRPLVIDGVSFIPGIVDNDDVETVLRYVLTQFHERVEPLRNPGCWGFAYRENRNDPNRLSRHSGGIAVDANAPAHPNGVPTARTFRPAQIAEVHRILLEVKNAVRWGGDYTGNPDAMHFEINTDPATLAEVAEGLRDDMPAPKDWTPADWAAFNEHASPVLAEALLDEQTVELKKADGSSKDITIRAAVQRMLNDS